MKDMEAAEYMVAFGRKIAGMPSYIRRDVEPATPRIIPVAQSECIKYSQRPNAFSLDYIREISEVWDAAEKSYLENIEACRRSMEGVNLGKDDKDIIVKGYEALEHHFKNVGRSVKKYGKVCDLSKFSEKKLPEFKAHMQGAAKPVMEALRGSEEEKGGVITYSDRFDIEFRPNKSREEFIRLLLEAQAGRTNDLYNLAESRIRQELEKACMAFQEREVERRYGYVMNDLSLLANGKLTERLKNYLGTLMGQTYAYNIEEILSGFEAATKKLFGIFHHHVDSPKIHYPDNFRGPAAEDIRISWECGPQIIFAPDGQKLGVHFISRGRPEMAGSYIIE